MGRGNGGSIVMEIEIEICWLCFLLGAQKIIRTRGERGDTRHTLIMENNFITRAGLPPSTPLPGATMCEQAPLWHEQLATRNSRLHPLSLSFYLSLSLSVCWGCCYNFMSDFIINMLHNVGCKWRQERGTWHAAGRRFVYTQHLPHAYCCPLGPAPHGADLMKWFRGQSKYWPWSEQSKVWGNPLSALERAVMFAAEAIKSGNPLPCLPSPFPPLNANLPPK